MPLALDMAGFWMQQGSQYVRYSQGPECALIIPKDAWVWRGGASLALVGHISSDGITIKMPYGVDVLLCRPALHSIFSFGVG